MFISRQFEFDVKTQKHRTDFSVKVQISHQKKQEKKIVVLRRVKLLQNG